MLQSSETPSRVLFGVNEFSDEGQQTYALSNEFSQWWTISYSGLGVSNMGKKDGIVRPTPSSLLLILAQA